MQETPAREPLLELQQAFDQQEHRRRSRSHIKLGQIHLLVFDQRQHQRLQHRTGQRFLHHRRWLAVLGDGRQKMRVAQSGRRFDGTELRAL